jgi:CubicO group peptidase (beta-lactamase class C family)/D-alanyl-D-alanine dipeptidase
MLLRAWRAGGRSWPTDRRVVTGRSAPFAAILAFLLLGSVSCVDAGGAQLDTIHPPASWQPVTDALTRMIEHEMADKQLPALSIALVDDQQIVWARGFGFARAADSVPATARTIYRVGSVSKLFTDLAVMQLVERGELDLDVPVSTYLHDFAPANDFGGDITLRQLMSHRAGLVREPPVGNYFDTSGVSLEATIASLNDTRLVYEPGSHPKYSNAGVATVGRVLEATQQQPFAPWLHDRILVPMGLPHAGFEPTDEIRSRLADAVMWTVDGREFPAPSFQLGMAPAGSMYASVTDLARFLGVLFAGGRAPDGAVVSEATLREMWTPQYAPDTATTGFGIGFAISRLDSAKVISHGGAIYGFATELSALPDERLGVVVATTRDGANQVTSRIAEMALRMMRAARAGQPLPKPVLTSPMSLASARAIEGSYGSGSAAVRLVARDSTVTLTRAVGGTPLRLMRMPGAGDTLVGDGALSFGMRVVPDSDAITIGGVRLARARDHVPAPPPARWRALIGEYGWDYNTLYVYEDAGRLRALIEWFFDYPLTEVAPDSFAFPASGLYDGERLYFERDSSGRVTGVEAASVHFPRRHLDGEDGQTFTITPLRGVEELRTEALAASPPEEEGRFRASDLVEVVTLDPSIRLDVRYATTNNFLRTPLYASARAFLQRPAAEALVRVQHALRARGYGLLIHDAYRPWYVTKMFWDATPDSQKVFVADPAAGSRHNRGAAVDLTLIDLRTGAPVEMTGGYDEFSPRSYPAYRGGTGLQRWHRELLRHAMEAEGFRVYDAEWWHFDYGEWRSYAIGNATFEELHAGAVVPAGR